MRTMTWVVRLLLFVLVVAFAAKNTDPATLRFYFGFTWEAPLVLPLFAFFAAGALFGVLAMLGRVIRQGREVRRLQRETRQQAAAAARGGATRAPVQDI